MAPSTIDLSRKPSQALLPMGRDRPDAASPTISAMPLKAHLRHGQSVEVPQKPVGDERPATARGAHCSYQLHVGKLPPGIVPRIPSAIVQVLAQQLDGWLGAVGFLGGHVEVVYKGQPALSNGRSIHAFAALIQATVDLGLVKGSDGVVWRSSTIQCCMVWRREWLVMLQCCMAWQGMAGLNCTIWWPGMTSEARKVWWYRVAWYARAY